MSEAKRFHQVTAPVHGDDGIAYGPGELHEPGSLPSNVPYIEVLADEVQQAAAPAHAQSERRLEEDAEGAKEVERIQTERSQPRVDGHLATDPVVPGENRETEGREAGDQQAKTSQVNKDAGEQPQARADAAQKPAQQSGK